MSQHTNDDTAEHRHPVNDLSTVVVDPDDVLEAIWRNDRDETEQRSHVLRVSPPLEGEQKATPHVSEDHTYYPLEMDPKPLHLSPEVLILGHGYGGGHPDWRNEWAYPDYGTEKALFRDEFDARGENGENRALTDEEEAEWDEWWGNVVEMWGDRVRHALENTEELTLTSQYPDVDDTTVKVRFEEDN